MIQHPGNRQANRRGGIFVLATVVVGSLLMLSSCKGDQQKPAPASAPPVAAPNAADFDPPASAPAAGKVDGKRAIHYAQEIVNFGPRPIASPTHLKVEDYIKTHLQGLQIEEDKFTANTAAGNFPMNNIIAKIPGKKDGIIVLASHYDTNYPLRDENFVGANDGAATSALLIELANQLKSKPNDGYSIWFVFTDGEEATVQWSDKDSLYGTKHLAAKWKSDGTAAKIKAFILLDMIGDKDLDVDKDGNSTPWLQEVVGRAAQRTGNQKYFYNSEQAMDDDHLPFKGIGVPVVDLIDFTYGFNNLYHHTTEDTMDKISANSLQVVGDTVLESIRALNTR
jgi:Zn-dependent M28 family amino/carboxypeptidase